MKKGGKWGRGEGGNIRDKAEAGEERRAEQRKMNSNRKGKKREKRESKKVC